MDEPNPIETITHSVTLKSTVHSRCLQLPIDLCKYPHLESRKQAVLAINVPNQLFGPCFRTVRQCVYTSMITFTRWKPVHLILGSGKQNCSSLRNTHARTRARESSVFFLVFEYLRTWCGWSDARVVSKVLRVPQAESHSLLTPRVTLWNARVCRLDQTSQMVIWLVSLPVCIDLRCLLLPC